MKYKVKQAKFGKNIRGLVYLFTHTVISPGLRFAQA
jgi:hypothetical protein